MAELVRALACGDEDGRRDRLAQRRGQLGVLEAGDRRQQPVVDAPAGGRGHADDLLRRLREALEADEQGVAQRGRQLPGVVRARLYLFFPGMIKILAQCIIFN